MHRTLRLTLLLGPLLTAALLTQFPAAGAQGAKYSIKQAKVDLPADLKPAIAKVLGPEAVQLLDGAGNVICDVWLRPQMTADATAEQVKNGLTYMELKETTLVGAVRFPAAYSDYRKQKIKAGTYTLRLGIQPMDGDHMGVSDHREFLLLVAAGTDASPDPIEPKELAERSAKSLGVGHPVVFMLFPNAKPAAAPKLVAEQNDHWVLQFRAEVAAAGTKTNLGFGLTLVGHAKE